MVIKVFSQSPTDPQFVQNPYAFYDQLRSSSAIAFWKELNMPVVSTFNGVNALLRDRRCGRQAPQGFEPTIPDHLQPFYDIENHSMLELEGDTHKRLRALVLRAFTSRRIKSLGPDIEAICATLLNNLPNQSDVDLLSLYAQQVPILVICRLLGIPETMSAQLLSWSHDMVALYTPSPTAEIELKAASAAAEFSHYMKDYVAKRRGSPADDLISELIAAEEDGEKLSLEELISTCILLLNAGHEATVHAIGIGVKLLLEHQAPLSALSPENINQTIEEILRYDPPLHMFTRWVYEDGDYLGQPLKRGDQIGLLLGAANRDPEKFQEPNIFQTSRKPNQNMSFGAGIHFCLGAPLARLEMQIAIPMLFNKLPNIKLGDKPVYANTWHFHGLETLRVSL